MKKKATGPKTHSTTSRSLIEAVSANDNFNIVNVLLLDHTYLKECIEVLTDEKEDKRIKMKYGKGFLDALKKHSVGEKKALYAPLHDVKDMHSLILESLIEHDIVDEKVKKLSTKLSNGKSLDDEMEAELKVLAEVVEHHLTEEENELFPKIQKEIDTGILNQMGYQFMLIREFTEKDLKDSPELWGEMEEVSHSAM